MRKVFFWGTIASGAIAAYLMHKRGATMGDIAKSAISNPIGSLVKEMKHA